MSGWRVDCPACGAGYLLPEELARPAARVRCPGCRAVFAAAEPVAVARAAGLLAPWLEARPGGVEAVREARARGRFWREHGEAWLRLCEGHARGVPPEAMRAALARALGPGPALF